MISKRARSRGYTAMELMISLGVLGVGAAGIITMQRVTAESNRHAKALVTATHIAQSWLDQLTADSAQWRTSGDFTGTHWLSQIGTANWFRPDYFADRDWGPSFDFAGHPMATELGAVFCTDLRLQWLFPEATPATGDPGSGLIRAEVRVIWLRDNTVALASPTANGACSWLEDEVTTNPEAGRAFHFVHMSSAIIQHDQL